MTIEGKEASAKCRSVKLLLMTGIAIISTIPVALLPSALPRVQQTAEFILLVVSTGLWNSVSTWINVPCLYVLLNIVLVTLAFISRAPPTSNNDRSHDYGTLSTQTEIIETITDADANHDNINVGSKLADPVENNFTQVVSPAKVRKPTAALVTGGRSRSFNDLEATLLPASALYQRKPGLKRSTTKLSNISKECCERREMTITESCTSVVPKTFPPSQLVVFEISTHVGNDYWSQAQPYEEDGVAMVKGDEETNMLHLEEDGMELSAEELYVKAESFIGDFHRQLKMQRHDSWNRLCGSY